MAAILLFMIFLLISFSIDMHTFDGWHQIFRKKFLRTLISIIFLGIIAGCAFQIPVLRVKPADWDVSGITKLGISTSNDSASSKEYVQEFAQKLKETLERKRFFQAIYLLEGAKNKSHPLDAVLNIRTNLTHVTRESGMERVEREEETGRRVKETYYENGQEKLREVPEKIKRIYYIPYAIKKASVDLRIHYRSLRPQGETKELQLRNQGKEIAVGDEQIQAIRSDEEMVQAVSNPLIIQLANKLVPHMIGEKIKLASHSACQPGLEDAKQGNWAEAVESWKGVIQSDDTNHAAHYNLGVAYEALKNYPAALSSYQKALTYSSRGMYQKALDRIKEVMEEDQRLQRQLRGRSL